MLEGWQLIIHGAAAVFFLVQPAFALTWFNQVHEEFSWTWPCPVKLAFFLTMLWALMGFLSGLVFLYMIWKGRSL